MPKHLRACLPALLLLLARPAHAVSRDVPFDTLMATDFAHVRVEVGALRSLDAQLLPLLRGVVFGRHGRIFKDPNIQEWLDEQPWYVGSDAFRNDSLSAIERENLDLIRQVEAESHPIIEPGDLRWWQDRRMTTAALGAHSRTEWAVLRAEVDAIHGRRFDAEPWLQRYFDERYWYRPDSLYDAKRLSEIERQNQALIDSLARAQGAGALAPCEMVLYEQRPVSPELLRGAGFATLRILRNEIYARHGMTFHPGPLAQWFESREWYEPRTTAGALSPLERRNVATIAAQERALHASLRTAALDTTLLAGLYAEEAHRLTLEIYARHGRVFRRKWEQDYVASLPGYRPDPGYANAALSDVERENIAALVKYEKTAYSVMNAVEG